MLLAMTKGAVSAFELVGHRGARGLAPENTLEGFAAALKIGVSALEFDLGLTRDGVVVIHHDPRLNPATTKGPNGRYLERPGPLIRALSFAELRAYEVGAIRPKSRYARRFPKQRPAPGARIPSPAELAQLLRRSGAKSVRLYAEIKFPALTPGEAAPREVLARAVVATLRKAGLAERTTILSFDWRVLQEAQRLAPEIPVGYLTVERGKEDRVRRDRPGASPWTGPFALRDHGGSLPRMVKAAGGALWLPFYRDLTNDDLAEAHALGLRVVVWTVNTARAMRRLIRLGVDGIVTDRPDVLRNAMAEEGLPLPAPIVFGTGVAPF